MPLHKKLWWVGGAITLLITAGLLLAGQSSGNIESIGGTDADQNGIRDDVDQFIVERYGDNPVALKAAQVSARAHQNILLVDSINKGEVLTAMGNSGDAGACAGTWFEEAGLNSGEELDTLFLTTYNTPERLEKHKSVSMAAGQFTRSVTSVVCE